jgi:hypothetical protein
MTKENSPEIEAMLRPTPPTLVFFGSEAINLRVKNPIS